jgi:hypothetical protein
VRDRLDEFLTFDSELLAISCDPTYALRAFADHDGLNFPLLSDYWPHGAVDGVFDERRGRRRSSFLIDREGVVRWTCTTTATMPRPRRSPGRAPARAGLDRGPGFPHDSRGHGVDGMSQILHVATAGDPRLWRSQLIWRR